MTTAYATINAILTRHQDYAGRFNVPGDWGERAFRGWLVLDLLHGTMRWPAAYILMGERHDILLLNQALSPVVTIETKCPGHSASPSERTAFETRLAHYGTLRWAFLTNGEEWTRLEITAPQGRGQVKDHATLFLSKTSEKAMNAYLDVLNPRHYLL